MSTKKQLLDKVVKTGTMLRYNPISTSISELFVVVTELVKMLPDDTEPEEVQMYECIETINFAKNLSEKSTELFTKGKSYKLNSIDENTASFYCNNGHSIKIDIDTFNKAFKKAGQLETNRFPKPQGHKQLMMAAIGVLNESLDDCPSEWSDSDCRALMTDNHKMNVETAIELLQAELKRIS